MVTCSVIVIFHEQDVELPNPLRKALFVKAALWFTCIWSEERRGNERKIQHCMRKVSHTSPKVPTEWAWTILGRQRSLHSARRAGPSAVHRTPRGCGVSYWNGSNVLGACTGAEVTFSTARPQALVWAIVQDATSTFMHLSHAARCQHHCKDSLRSSLLERYKLHHQCGQDSAAGGLVESTRVGSGVGKLFTRLDQKHISKSL